MKTNEGKPFITADDIQWETVDNGVQRKILGFDSEIMMVCVKFEQGAVGTLHHHVHRQNTYVAEGSFEVTIDGVKQQLKQGDCFFVAPDLIHGVLALEKGILVDVFTPYREEFLK